MFECRCHLRHYLSHLFICRYATLYVAVDKFADLLIRADSKLWSVLDPQNGVGVRRPTGLEFDSDGIVHQFSKWMCFAAQEFLEEVVEAVLEVLCSRHWVLLQPLALLIERHVLDVFVRERGAVLSCNGLDEIRPLHVGSRQSEEPHWQSQLSDQGEDFALHFCVITAGRIMAAESYMWSHFFQMFLLLFVLFLCHDTKSRYITKCNIPSKQKDAIHIQLLLNRG